MRPKRFQQGGVFDPAVNIPNVGGIQGSPRINPPQVAPSSLPDLLSLIDDAETRKYREEQRLLREQALVDDAQQQFFELRDPIFGELHNPQQIETAKRVREKYGLSDTIDFDVNNIYTLKSQTNKLRLAARDPDLMKVFGEVEAAKKFRDLAARPGSMTSDEIEGFNSAWDEYIHHDGEKPFDVNRLFPSAFNKPKEPKQPDFAITSRATMANNLGLDLTNDQDKSVLFDNIANAWYQKDAEGAAKLGYLTIDPTTQFPVLTPLGQQTALNQYQGLQSTYVRKQEDQLQQFETKKQISERFEDSPSSSKTEVKNQTAYLGAWSAFIRENPDLAELDPDDPDVKAYFSPLVVKGGLSTSDKVKQSVADDLATLLPTPDPQAELKRYERQQTLNKALQQSNVAPVTTIVAPSNTVAPKRGKASDFLNN